MSPPTVTVSLTTTPIGVIGAATAPNTSDGFSDARPIRIGPGLDALCLGRHALPAPLHDALNDAPEQLLRYGKNLPVLGGCVHGRVELLRVQEGVRVGQQLVARGALPLLAAEAPPHRADQAGRHAAAVLSGLGELDLVGPVDDGLAARHLVGDLAEGREAVHHLVEDTPQAPDVAGLAELHELRLALLMVS